MLYLLSVVTPLSDEWKQTSSFHLVLLDVIDFEVILGMDWLAQYYASLDCREKVVIFKIPNNDEF